MFTFGGFRLEILAHARVYGTIFIRNREIDRRSERGGVGGRGAVRRILGLLSARFRRCRKCNNRFDPADTRDIPSVVWKLLQRRGFCTADWEEEDFCPLRARGGHSTRHLI